MAAVLDGRGEGENINLVADALHRTGYLEKLFDADRVGGGSGVPLLRSFSPNPAEAVLEAMPNPNPNPDPNPDPDH